MRIPAIRTMPGTHTTVCLPAVVNVRTVHRGDSARDPASSVSTKLAHDSTTPKPRGRHTLCPAHHKNSRALEPCRPPLQYHCQHPFSSHNILSNLPTFTVPPGRSSYILNLQCAVRRGLTGGSSEYANGACDAIRNTVRVTSYHHGCYIINSLLLV